MASTVFNLKMSVNLGNLSYRPAEVSSFSTFRRFLALLPLLRPCYSHNSVIGPLGTVFAYKTGESPCGAGVDMMIKKMKLVGITAGLILACGLLSAAVGASQQSGHEPNAAISGQIQKNAPETQPPYEPFGVSGEKEFFYKMLVSVLVVAGLGAGVVYVSKKLLPKISNLPGKQIRVIETHHLAPRKSIHLIAAGSRRLLIGSTNDTITMLADVTDFGQSLAAELEKRS
jgi:flagellar biogenesis protein FliO